MNSEGVMKFHTHGTAALRPGRVFLETDYHSGDGGAGLLSLRLEDHETGVCVEGQVRLDPWTADAYELIEFKTGNCFLICGEQAVVAVDASSLVWLSSVVLEYEEADNIDSPWHVEIEPKRWLLVATERRVWCVDERGTIRWLWSCMTGDRPSWVVAAPVVAGDRVRVPLQTAMTAHSVELRLGDGLPA